MLWGDKYMRAYNSKLKSHKGLETDKTSIINTLQENYRLIVAKNYH